MEERDKEAAEAAGGKEEEEEGEEEDVEVTPVEEEENAGLELDGETFLLDTLLDSEQLGPAVKTVFEAGPEKEKRMVKRLAELAASKQKEVQDICNFHYQDFITAVDDLLELRVETSSLRTNVVSLDSQLQQSGRKLLDKSKEMVRLVKMQENIRRSRQQLVVCANVVKGIEAVQKAIDSDHSMAVRALSDALQWPIGALRLLREMRESCMNGLAHGSGGYEWAKYYMVDVIPQQEASIRAGATQKFNEWLVWVRDLSADVGAFALAQAADSKLRSDEEARGGTALAFVGNSAQPTHKQRLEHYVKATSRKLRPLDMGSARLFEMLKLDVTPVYQNIHIHEMLEMPEEFLSHYTQNRRMQCNLALQLDNCFSSSSQAPRSLHKQIEEYFRHIAGFFYIEAHIYDTTTDFLSRADMDELFSLATSKASTVVQEVLAVHGNDDLTHVVDVVSLFAEAMHRCEYDVSPIYHLLSQISDQCSEAALRKAHDRFIVIFGEEKYEPMRLSTRDPRYSALIQSSGLEQFDLLSDENAAVFAFSSAVPLVCAEVQQCMATVNDYTHFCKNPEEQLIQQVSLLVRQLNNSIALNMEESYEHSNIAQLVQLYQNITYLARTSIGLEMTLARMGYSAGTIQRATVPVQATLRKSLDLAEDMLLKLLKRKIDLFLEQATDGMQWLPREAPRSAHDHVQDLTIYMEALYQMLAPLEPTIHSKLLGHAHQYIASTLLEQLSGEGIVFNRNLVLGLQKDVMFLVGAAKKLGVNDAGSFFASLAQVIDILLCDQPDSYLDKRTRKSDFPDVEPEVLLAILPRYQPNSQQSRTSVNEQSLAKLQQALASIVQERKGRR